MAQRPPGKLNPIGQIIHDSLEIGFLGLAREMVRVFDVWEDAVGSYNASKAKPESIKDGRLTVIVESPVWISHFNYLKTEFIDRINQALGAPIIQQIIFRAGHIDSTPKPLSQDKFEKDNAPIKEAVPSPEIRRAVALIEDPELRETMALLLSRQGSGHTK